MELVDICNMFDEFTIILYSKLEIADSGFVGTVHLYQSPCHVSIETLFIYIMDPVVQRYGKITGGS